MFTEGEPGLETIVCRASTFNPAQELFLVTVKVVTLACVYTPPPLLFPQELLHFDSKLVDPRLDLQTLPQLFRKDAAEPIFCKHLFTLREIHFSLDKHVSTLGEGTSTLWSRGS